LKQKESIFFDASGKRKKVLSGLGTFLGLTIAVVTTIFAFTLFVIPLIPPIPGLTSIAHRQGSITLPGTTSEKARLSRYLLHASKVSLWEEIKSESEAKVLPAGKIIRQPGKIVAGYYAPWDETGLNSFRINAGKLNVLFPAWLKLNKTGTSIDTSDWEPDITPHNLDVVQIATNNNVKIEPVLSNAQDDLFDPDRVHNLLNSEKIQKEVALYLNIWLLKNKFNGIQIDFENLNRDDYKKLPDFLKLIKKYFGKDSLVLSLAVEADNTGLPIEELNKSCDFFVLMAYDEHYSTGAPGPIASIPWYYKTLSNSLEKIPPEKLIAGIGNYSYDWETGKDSSESISYQSAIILARDYTTDENQEKIITFDPDALNPTFNYTGDDGNAHTVWMLDAVTAYNQLLIARNKKIGGYALWDLGSEDPSLWKFFNKNIIDSTLSPDSLENISFPYEIEFDGDGEVLTVESTPQRGLREITVDAGNGLCTGMEYTKFPSSYVIRRTGYIPNALTLTFDDGPSDYTAKILDELKELNVHGTFFLIGENAEKYPSLVKRILAEGNYIGNHTFTHPNIAAVSSRRAELELNTTERALQSITGRSTILFRPPYNADAEPVSAEEVKPILLASNMGYITIGELIDPQDWNLWQTNSNGVQEKRTVNDIVQSVLDQVKSIQGNVILMHDGGGDRSLTIKALPIIVDTLRKRGYNFVDISQIVGQSRDMIMPLLSSKDQALIGIDRPVFDTIFTFERVLSYAFITAIILGILRVLFVTILALIKKSLNKRRTYSENYRPTVSFIIAAFNEEKVIGKTVESALQSNYPDIEVIVVDDGSVDNTSGEIINNYKNDTRVVLIKQPNSGKAAALNNAIEIAKGEILISLDADTQISKDAVSLLVRHFENTTTGAVAGNVKVGNRTNIFTKWQAIEYITSQNIDRQGYSLLNAITVVPGAIGAWRKSAIKGIGGYITDTLAEDMDLTWRFRQYGWNVDTENEAIGYTEAPDSIGSFFKQRFRWSFGTLQCLWKHKSALFKYGWFGWLALPSLWIFQIVFQVIAPLVDIQIIYTLIQFSKAWITQGIYTRDWQPLPQTLQLLEQTAFFYVLLFLIELTGAFIAFRFDKEKLRLLWWLFLQRFVYRQLMYAVVWKALTRAFTGGKQGWGKLQRKATVNSPAKG
jgi:poly-beta-1,6 N-acetyl-D-glucosamine synthase